MQMKNILSVLISMLMLSSMVSAAFIGAGLPFTAIKKANTVSNNNKENIIPTFQPSAAPQPVAVKAVAMPAVQELEQPKQQPKPKHKFGPATPRPVAMPDEASSAPKAGISSISQPKPNTITQDHSVVIAGLLNGDIYAYDSNNMKLLWSDTTSHSGYISDIQFDGSNTVYIASGDGSVTRYNSNTGAAERTYSISPGYIVYSIALDSDYIYAGNELGKLYKVRKSDGNIMWSVQVFDSANGASWDNAYSVRLIGSYLYAGGGLGYVYKYDKSGNRVGQLYYDYASKIYTMEPTGSTLYWADSTSYNNGMVYDGTIHNSGTDHPMHQDTTKIYDMAIDGSTLYASQMNGKVSVWDLTSHTHTADISAASSAVGTVAVNDNYIYTGSQDNNMKRYDKSRNYVDSVNYGAEVTQIGVEYTTTSTNEPPVLDTPLPDRTIVEDSANNILFDLDNYFSDFEGNDLTYTTSGGSGLATFTVNANNELVATGVADANGQADITVTATDSGGATVSGTFQLTVTAVNDAPVVSTPLPDKSIAEDSSNNNLFDLDNYFSDPDGDTLSYTASNYDSGLISVTINANNEVIVSTATPNLDGQTAVTISATDGIDTVQDTFVVTVTPVNDAPVVSAPLPDETIDEGSTGNVLFDLDNYFSDVDGDTLSYTASNYDSGLINVTINANNEVVVDAATPHGTGFTDVTITASDGQASTSDSFRLTVQEINNAPVLDAIGAQTAYVGVPYYYDVNATDPDGDTLTYYNAPNTLFTIDSATGVISFTPAVSDVGDHDVTISVSDGYLQDSETVTFHIVDQEAPAVVITEPENTTYNPAPELHFTVSEPATCEYSLDGAANQTASNGTALAAVEGANTVTVYCTDPSGNVGSDTVAFSLDTTVPAVAIVSPTNTTYNTAPTLNFTVSEPATCEYSLDGAANQTASNGTLLAAADGTHTVTVYCHDAVNTGSDTVAFSLDTVAPDVAITYPADGSYLDSVPFDLTWTSTATDVDHYTVNGMDVGNTTNYTLNLADGSYTYEVVAYDAGGNTGNDSVSFTIDTAAPVISNVAFSLTYENATVTWDTNEEADSMVEYGLTTAYGANVSDAAYVTAHSIFIGGLTANTTYYFRISSTDRAGNTATATQFANGTEFNFTTPSEPNVAPQLDQPLPDKHIKEDTPGGTFLFDLDNYFSDANGDTLTYTATGYDGTLVNITIDAGNNVYASTVTPNAYGATTVNITASDGSLTASDEFALFVDSVNDPPVANFTANATAIYETEAVQFDGTGSYDIDDGIASYVWDFNDGATANGTGTPGIATHTFNNAGTYNVTLTVTDNSGASDTTNMTITVLPNTFPDLTVMSVWASDSRPEIGETATIYANVTNIGAADAAGAVVVNMTGDATGQATITNLAVGEVKQVTFTASWASAGAKSVTVTIDPADSYHEENEANNQMDYTLTVNAAPVAAISMPAHCYVNGPCDYNGSASTDDVNVTGYYWDFGGTGNSTSAAGTWHFGAEGNYTVTLTVTDTDGATGTANKTVNVTNGTGIPPVADAGSDQAVPVNTIVTFDGSNSTDDLGIYSYEWAFGNGTLIGSGVAPAYNFTSVGVYTVKLKVTDLEGLTDEDHMAVTVYDPSNPLPDLVARNLTVADYSPTVGDTDNATVEIYNLGGADAANFTVALTDTQNQSFSVPGISIAPGEMQKVTFQWIATGVNTTLTATADSGNTVAESDETNNNATLSLIVGNGYDPNYAPTAVITASTTSATTGTAISFDAYNSTDSDGSIVSYTWHFGDGTTATGNATSHSYSAAGTYTVRLTVADNDGATGTAMLAVTISSSSGNDGNGGTGGFPVISPTHAPASAANTTRLETPIFIDNLVTYQIGDFTITRDYFYNPNTNAGWYTMNIVNTGDKNYVIKLEDPNPYNAEESVAPDYTVGNRLGWELNMTAAAMFEVTYNFKGNVTPAQVKAIGVPVLEDITPKPAPAAQPAVTPSPVPKKPVATNPLTGLLTLLNPKAMEGWATTVALLAAIVLASVAWVLFKEEGNGFSIIGKPAGSSTLGEVNFNQPGSAYAEGTLY